MRVLVLAVALAMFATAAVAQSTNQQHNPALLDENARVQECMKQWDRSTHMTKKEWDDTCRRVANERIKYLREQGYGSEGKYLSTTPSRQSPN